MYHQCTPTLWKYTYAITDVSAMLILVNMLILAVLTERYTVWKSVENGFIYLLANSLDLMSDCGSAQADLQLHYPHLLCAKCRLCHQKGQIKQKELFCQNH